MATDHHNTEVEPPGQIGWIFIALVLNAFVGICLFEYAWADTRPIRNVIEERDGKYPAYRRWDAPKWRRWKFYPGALTLMPLRFIASMLIVGLCYLFVRSGTLGHSFSRDEPIRGWCRNTVIGYTYKFFTSLLLLTVGCWSWKTQVDYDYSEYLGEGYKANVIGPKHVSTYVANHTGWADIIAMVSYFRPAFASKKALRKVPFLGLLVQALGCIFISRGGTLEERNRIVEQISERQQVIEETGDYPPICIFPEGGTSNGRYLLQFKRGAFAAEKSVKPVVLKYSYGVMSPAYDIIRIIPHMIMTLCMLCDFKIEVLELPTFVPNEYMYQTHADKIDRAHSTTWHQDHGQHSASKAAHTVFYDNEVHGDQPSWTPERWEIYAWAVRDVMSKAGGLIKNDQPYREKLQYEGILGYRSAEKAV